MKVLRSLLRHHFARKPVVTWRNVGCSLRLIISSYQKESEILPSSPPKNDLGYELRSSWKTMSIYGNFQGTPFAFAINYIETVTASKSFFERNWKQFSSRSYSQYNTSSIVTCFRPSSFDCVDIDADCLYSRWWNTRICSWRLVSKQGAFFDRHKLETFGHSKQALLN